MSASCRVVVYDVPMATEDCAYLRGAGCGREPVCEEDTAESSEDTGDGLLVGRTCACGGVSGGGWLVALVVGLLVLARRFRWVFLVCLACAVAFDARADVDAQRLQPLDGGPFTALREADIGAAWSVRASAHVGAASDLATLQTPDGAYPLLEWALSAELGGSVRIAEAVRVGVAVAHHPWIVWDGAYRFGVPGDTALWAQVPIVADERRGRTLSSYVQIDLPTGSTETLLSDRNGGVHLLVAGGATVRRTELLANIGVRASDIVLVPGHAWGARLSGGLGVWRPFGRVLFGSVELDGSVPLGEPIAPGNSPAEVLACAGVRLAGGFQVRGGVGAGLSDGIGSPGVRWLVQVTRDPRPAPDTDGDGLLDDVDRCVTDPEDRDGVSDADGCPEADADADGILDPADTCPTRPETPNRWQDEDGCPDRATVVQLTVRGDGLEVAQVRVEEEPASETVADVPRTLVLPPGRRRIEVTAPGFEAHVVLLDVPDAPEAAHTVVLERVRFGAVRLRLVGADGASLAGHRLGAAGVIPVAAEGSTFELPSGPRALTVGAPGHSTRTVPVEVPASATVDLVVTLGPSAVRRAGNRLETTSEVRFPLDSAEILDAGPLGDLAALLLADPSVRLVRVEGHADGVGSSAYNLDLSRRRAQAVVEWLVGAGVARERLEAIGTGEARAGTPEASRRVSFLVLVWADEAPE